MKAKAISKQPSFYASDEFIQASYDKSFKIIEDLRLYLNLEEKCIRSGWENDEINRSNAFTSTLRLEVLMGFVANDVNDLAQKLFNKMAARLNKTPEEFEKEH